MSDNGLYEKIESYLLNRMTEEERAAFELEMAADPTVARQFARQRKDHEMMEALLAGNLRGKLKKWEQEATAFEEEAQTSANKKTPSRKIRRRWLLAGLAFVLIVLSGILLIQNKEEMQPPVPSSGDMPPMQTPDKKEQQQPGDQQFIPTAPSAQPGDSLRNNTSKTPSLPKLQAQKTQYRALAEAYRKKINFNESIIRSGSESRKLYADAMAHLYNKRYDQGVALLLSVPDTSSVYWDAQYHLGLAYFASNRTSQAIPVLTKLAGQTGNLLSEDATWYLAVAYLHEGQISRSIMLLDQMLADKEHSCFEKAADLKEKLKATE